MYRCECCGHVFEEGEQKVWKEERGECWGSPAYETVSGCPICGGGYEEAEPCKICGGYSGEMNSGFCEECISEKCAEYKYKFKDCFLIAERSTPEDVEINSFLSAMFTTEQINEILFKELWQCSTTFPVDCSVFIDADRGWFAENAVEYEKEKDEELR